jgi:hypothetical protein
MASALKPWFSAPRPRLCNQRGGTCMYASSVASAPAECKGTRRDVGMFAPSELEGLVGCSAMKGCLTSLVGFVVVVFVIAAVAGGNSSNSSSTTSTTEPAATTTETETQPSPPPPVEQTSEPSHEPEKTPEPSSEEDEVGSAGHAGDIKFCEEHECIGKFTTEEGTIVECSDGAYSHAGGISGACSHHGGEKE